MERCLPRLGPGGVSSNHPETASLCFKVFSTQLREHHEHPASLGDRVDPGHRAVQRCWGWGAGEGDAHADSGGNLSKPHAWFVIVIVIVIAIVIVQVDYQGNVTLLTQAIYMSKCKVFFTLCSFSWVPISSYFTFIFFIFLYPHISY